MGFGTLWKFDLGWPAEGRANSTVRNAFACRIAVPRSTHVRIVQRNGVMLRRFLNKLGYELHCKRDLARFPYQKNYVVDGVEFSIWVADETSRRWYDIEFNKNELELQCLKELTAPAEHILEFGVHYGFYACYLASVAKNGAYLGVELDPKAAMYANSQLSLNRFTNRAHVINAAGGANSGAVRLDARTNGNSFVATRAIGRSIPMVSGDGLTSRGVVVLSLIHI